MSFLSFFDHLEQAFNFSSIAEYTYCINISPVSARINLVSMISPPLWLVSCSYHIFKLFPQATSLFVLSKPVLQICCCNCLLKLGVASYPVEQCIKCHVCVRGGVRVTPHLLIPLNIYSCSFQSSKSILSSSSPHQFCPQICSLSTAAPVFLLKSPRVLHPGPGGVLMWGLLFLFPGPGLLGSFCTLPPPSSLS